MGVRLPRCTTNQKQDHSLKLILHAARFEPTYKP